MPFFAGASLAVGAFSAYSSSKAGAEQAEAQEDAYEREAELKLQAINAQVDDINARRQEEFDVAASQYSETTRQAMINRGRLAAAASDGGVAGSSISGVYMATFLEQARAQGQEISNFKSKNEQLNRDIRAVQIGLDMPTRPSAGYDSTGDWLGFASDALTIGNKYFNP